MELSFVQRIPRWPPNGILMELPSNSRKFCARLPTVILRTFHRWHTRFVSTVTD
ncbi:UNVERIFIED_CONTAM: hypothetical protein NCL1_51249 [Trichonephila clavipes]